MTRTVGMIVPVEPVTNCQRFEAKAISGNSGDHCRTWSRQRYDIPVREFECDRKTCMAETFGSSGMLDDRDPGAIQSRQPQHVVITVDGGPNILILGPPGSGETEYMTSGCSHDTAMHA
jgi:hypothetical protein